MSAFDQAWDLVKMPLDYTSINVAESDRWGEEDTAFADFVHPRIPSIKYRMKFMGDLSGAPSGRVNVKNEFGEPIGSTSFSSDPDQQRVNMLDDIITDNVMGDEPDEDDPSTWGGYDDFEDAMEGYNDERRELLERYAFGRIYPDTDVRKPYQRMGIASAMYDFLSSLGIDMMPDIIQSNDARALWAKNQGEPIPPPSDIDAFSDIIWNPTYEKDDDFWKYQRIMNRRGHDE